MASVNRWSYSLSVVEEAVCAQVGWNRQQEYLGRPDKNINYSEGDVWESFQHMVCAGSELALARMFGLKSFVPSCNTYKTELDIPGVGEVRYSERGLRFTTRDDPKLKYILLVGGLGIKTRRVAPDWLGAPYVAVGWMYGHECVREEWRFNKNTFYAPRALIHTMPV